MMFMPIKLKLFYNNFLRRATEKVPRLPLQTRPWRLSRRNRSSDLHKQSKKGRRLRPGTEEIRAEANKLLLLHAEEQRRVGLYRGL